MLYANTSTMGLVPLKWRSFTFTTNATENTIDSIVWAGDVVGITTADKGNYPVLEITGHPFAVGDLITIAGATPADFNGTFSVITVVDVDNIAIKLLGAEALGTVSGTITWSVPLGVQVVKFSTPATNADSVEFGPNSSANSYSLGAGAELNLTAPGGAKFFLSDWYAQAATASQDLVITFI